MHCIDVHVNAYFSDVCGSLANQKKDQNPRLPAVTQSTIFICSSKFKLKFNVHKKVANNTVTPCLSTHERLHDLLTSATRKPSPQSWWPLIKGNAEGNQSLGLRLYEYFWRCTSLHILPEMSEQFRLENNNNGANLFTSIYSTYQLLI